MAQQAPVLDQNFRSRPSVLRALQALYDNGGEDAFLERDIRFERVRPGGVRSDADYLRDGQAAKALTLRVLRSGGDKAMSADASRDAATQACVAAIHQILVDARAGNAVLRGRPVQPGDIAVLVRSHREATLVQRALAAVGIPAVAAGKQSLLPLLKPAIFVRCCWHCCNRPTKAACVQRWPPCCLASGPARSRQWNAKVTCNAGSRHSCCIGASAGSAADRSQ